MILNSLLASIKLSFTFLYLFFISVIISSSFNISSIFIYSFLMSFLNTIIFLYSYILSDINICLFSLFIFIILISLLLVFKILIKSDRSLKSSLNNLISEILLSRAIYSSLISCLCLLILVSLF